MYIVAWSQNWCKKTLYNHVLLKSFSCVTALSNSAVLQMQFSDFIQHMNLVQLFCELNVTSHYLHKREPQCQTRMVVHLAFVFFPCLVVCKDLADLVRKNWLIFCHQRSLMSYSGKNDTTHKVIQLCQRKVKCHICPCSFIGMSKLHIATYKFKVVIRILMFDLTSHV